MATTRDNGGKNGDATQDDDLAKTKNDQIRGACFKCLSCIAPFAESHPTAIIASIDRRRKQFISDFLKKGDTMATTTRPTRQTLATFARSLDISPRSLRRYANDPEVGFLYRHIYQEPRATPTGKRRKFWAPWQVQLIAAVGAGRLTIAEARVQYDAQITIQTTPQATPTTEFSLPGAGRPRRSA